jgi:hypothetical protein
MYGMGTFLAAFSAWLLLRALRASGRRPAWWVGYGITAALFLLTHHFAVFTLAAQAALGLWCAFARRAADLFDQRAARRGILLAAAVGLLLYGPWLPAALAQINRVSQAFWIQEQSALEWGQTFVRWCVGIDWANATLIVGCLFVAALAAVHALRLGYRSHHAPRDVALPGEMGKLKVDFPSRGARGPQADASSRPGAPGRGLRNAAAIALLAQATLPWVAIGLISTVGKHPMLQDRYLAFSHASWLALSGVTIASIRRIEWRIGLAALLVGTTLIGTDQFIRALPDGPPGIVASSERLARDYQPGGIVLVQDAPSLNCLRLYLSQIGANDVDVRAMLRPWPSPGHINHVASLGSWEFLDRVENLRYDVPQLWFAGTPNKLPGGGNLPGWQWMEEITYKGHGPQAPDYILRRYERPSAGKPKPVSAE